MAKFRVRRICESRGINVSYGLTKEGRTPETHTVVAKHALTEAIDLGELKLSEQADLIRFCTLGLVRTSSDDNARFTTVLLAMQKLWARMLRFMHGIGKTSEN